VSAEQARAEILARVRDALADVAPSPLPPPAYRRRGAGDRAAVTTLFAERCTDYRAGLRRVSRGSLRATIDDVVRGWGARRIAVPSDLPTAWLGNAAEWVEDRGLTPADLDAVDGVLTGCALAIAETGTIALDAGRGQGRRALTLVPDRHLCVVAAERIVELVPEAIAGLAEAAEAGRPITLISGPSATSDIELERVEGVHGPRTLEVVVVEG